MRYFYDTEFWERGPGHPIHLLSIGIVRESDDAVFYAVNADAPWDEIETADDAAWLRENVLPFLGSKPYTPLVDIRRNLLRFMQAPSELWAYYSDYDHVVLCQIFGRMIDLPRGFPMWTHDLMQEMDRRGFKRNMMPPQVGVEHNALEDARWVRNAWRSLQ